MKFKDLKNDGYIDEDLKFTSKINKHCQIIVTNLGSDWYVKNFEKSFNGKIIAILYNDQGEDLKYDVNYLELNFVYNL